MRGVSVVASGLRYRLYNRAGRPPEVNYENKYMINYSEQPSFHTLVYIISREIFFHVVVLFPNPKRSVGCRTCRFIRISHPNTSILPCTSNPSSEEPRFELANVN